MKIPLRYPATPENASDHAALAIGVAQQQWDTELDYSSHSLESLDSAIDTMREEGRDGEEVAEVLFVFGCYLGEVLVRQLGGVWTATARSALRGVSPWPMVVVLPDGSAWDAIGKAYKRLELGDSEYLPAFFEAAAIHGNASP